jgi:hypothetical protein
MIPIIQRKVQNLKAKFLKSLMIIKVQLKMGKLKWDLELREMIVYQVLRIHKKMINHLALATDKCHKMSLIDYHLSVSINQVYYVALIIMGLEIPLKIVVQEKEMLVIVLTLIED